MRILFCMNNRMEVRLLLGMEYDWEVLRYYCLVEGVCWGLERRVGIERG